MIYYDVNVQIWEEEDGVIYYSVIQEFAEDGSEEEVITYGSTNELSDAIKTARAAVDEVLSAN